MLDQDWDQRPRIVIAQGDRVAQLVRYWPLDPLVDSVGGE